MSKGVFTSYNIREYRNRQHTCTLEHRSAATHSTALCDTEGTFFLRWVNKVKYTV